MENQEIKITRTDCEQILEKHFDHDETLGIKAFCTTPINAKGFLGEYWLLKIQLVNDEVLQFFVKTKLIKGEGILAISNDGNVFNKELYCYEFMEKVARNFNFDVSFAPKYYLSRDNEMIVLEDIAIQGYQNGNDNFILDLEHIKLMLSKIAKFHVTSIIYEKLTSKTLTEDYGAWCEEVIYADNKHHAGFRCVQSAKKGLISLIKLLPKNILSAQDFQRKLVDLCERAFQDIKPSKRFKNVWCHGDAWANNFMFKYENGVPVDCKIYDFQLNRYNPPAHDVLFVICHTADEAVMQENFRDLLDYYYDELKTESSKVGLDVSKIINKDDYFSSVKVLFPVVKLTKVLYKSFMTLNSSTFENLTADQRKYSDFLLVDRSDVLQQAFQTDENYRVTTSALLRDLEEILIDDIITREECYEILNKKLGDSKYKLLRYKTDPVTAINCDDYVKLAMQINRKGETREYSFLVKILPKSENQLEFNLHTKIFSRIVENACVPSCYLARIKDVMVFDDLYSKASDNITLLNDYKNVSFVIKKLATFHTIGFIADKGLKENREFFDYYKNTSMETIVDRNLFVRKLHAALDCFPQLKSKLDADLFKSRTSHCIETMSKALRPSTRYPNTICHGDLCFKNVVVQHKDGSPVDCYFVNFRKSKYNPPTNDLIVFLYTFTDNAFRNKHTPELLKLYYDRLSETLKNNYIDIDEFYPYSKFLESYEEAKEFGIVHCLLAYSDLILNENRYTNNWIVAGKIQECADDLMDTFTSQTCAP